MEQVTVDITIEDLHVGDIYLLCSDGLCDMLTDEELMRTVNSAPSLAAAAMALVDFANERGGLDNITVALTKALG